MLDLAVQEPPGHVIRTDIVLNETELFATVVIQCAICASAEVNAR